MGIRQKKKLQKIWKHFGKSVICMLQLLFLRGRPKSHLCEWVPCETILIFILRKWLKIVKNTWRQFFKINERSFLKAWSLFCNFLKKWKSLRRFLLCNRTILIRSSNTTFIYSQPFRTILIHSRFQENRKFIWKELGIHEKTFLTKIIKVHFKSLILVEHF